MVEVFATRRTAESYQSCDEASAREEEAECIILQNFALGNCIKDKKEQCQSTTKTQRRRSERALMKVAGLDVDGIVKDIKCTLEQRSERALKKVAGS